MKSVLLFLLAGTIIYSCDKREDTYASKNNAPVGSVTLLNQNSPITATWLSDSVVIDTLKLGRYFRFRMELEDETYSLGFDYNGSGDLYKNGSLFSSATEIESGSHLFEWYPNQNQTGDVSFTIKLTDAYGKMKTYKFNIHVFDNRIPEVSWEIENVGFVGPLDKKIVVSGSDGDELYGGSILYYEYVINQDTTISPSNEFNYVFPQSGNYRISVRAMDSDNTWSNAVTIDPYVIQ